MGKQKSFIIVGSTFIGIILLLLLIPVLTRGLKETKCYFEMESVNIEIGKERATAPTIYASGNVQNIKMSYSVDNNEIVAIQKGAHAVGSYPIICWKFQELDKDNKPIEKQTRVSYNSEDKISIIDGYWAINDSKTEYTVEKEYADNEIYEHAVQGEVSIKCYILNGIQTDIPYVENVVPTRNEETKTWFINGVDTGYSYEGIHITLLGKKAGSSVLTFTGEIDGVAVSASMTVNVVYPDPTGIVSNHVDNTLIIKKGQTADLDYEVTDASLVAQANQKVNITISSGSSVQLDNNKVTGKTEGTTNIKISVPKESFTGVNQNYSVTVKVLVVDVDDVTLANLIAAHEAIYKIGEVVDSNECRQLVASATTAVEKLTPSQKELLPNDKKYNSAVEAIAIYDKIHVVANQINLGDLSNKNADFNLPKLGDNTTDYKITWRSSDTSVIKVQTIKEGELKDTHYKAVVSNVTEAKEVKLTATIGYSGYKVSKEFIVTVIPQ